MKVQLEPARSYDAGTYLWGIGCSLDGPESKRIEAWDGQAINPISAKRGFDDIDASFEMSLLSQSK